MGKIHLIQGFEKIAAGEVIERPASVVKELLENALDATASIIFVTIHNAGKDLIQLEDNGIGITEDDLYMAFKRHTSSKIESADELDQIRTLGFRGEALASIAAVSQIEIISRPPHQDYGVRLRLEGSEKISQEQCGAPKGTKIQVKNLFYNLPVRKKFLKSKRVELGHISDIITRYSLAYPHVHFKLIHNDLVLINSPAFQDSKPSTKNTEKSNVVDLNPYHFAIQTIYGQKVRKEMFSVTFEDENIRLFGFLGSPEISRSDRQAASFFVNKRYVYNKIIFQILQDAYKGYLMRHKYPFFVLFLEISPAQVDFNIHPTKKTVKFAAEYDIFNILRQVIRKKVENYLQKMTDHLESQQNTNASKLAFSLNSTSYLNSQHKNIEPSKSTQYQTSIKKEETFLSKHPKFHSNASKISQKSTKTSHKAIQTHLNPEHSQRSEKIGISPQNKPNSNSLPTKITSPANDQQNLLINTSFQFNRIPNFNLLNNGIQAGDTYLVFQDEEGLILFDQHAAHERINLEKIKNLYNSEKKSIQKLISPLNLTVAPNEVEFVKEAIPELRKYGFNLEFFGGTSFIIRSIPVIFTNKHLSNSVIIDMCKNIIEMGRDRSFKSIKDEIFEYMACHQSIRAGDEIWDRRTVKKILDELDSCNNPGHCAHGRPTYIKISFKELEKRFHRIV